MKPCSRVGIDVTKRCNWRCQTCFYRWKPDFNTPADRSLMEVLADTKTGQARGCDHAVLVGQGEPALWPPLLEWISECKRLGMTTSIITNGTANPDYYDKMYVEGLDHLHVSVHGLGETLDEIAGVPNAAKLQKRLLDWLSISGQPWRMNMTVQRANYEHLSEIADYCIVKGCRHIIALGFLPHYEWNDPSKLREVAVDPRELRPHLQDLVDLVEGHNQATDDDTMLTIRYHPFCCIDEACMKYVVNARFVLYDPWEWDYGHRGENETALWASARALGDQVAVTGEPCKGCCYATVCGGWNRTYAAAFPGCLNPPIKDIWYAQGYFHDQNPANQGKGYFG